MSSPDLNITRTALPGVAIAEVAPFADVCGASVRRLGRRRYRHSYDDSITRRIDLIQGSSIAPEIIARVREVAEDYERIMVCHYSNQTHEHVLAELEACAPLVSRDSYCVVFDTMIEDLPDEMFPDRPWSKRDSPKAAMREYLRCIQMEGRRAMDGSALGVQVDKMTESRLLNTVEPDGYLKRTA